MIVDNNHQAGAASEASGANSTKKQRREGYLKAVERALAKLANAVELDTFHSYLEDNEVGGHDLSIDQRGNLLAVLVDPANSFKDNAYIPRPQNLLTISPSGEYGLEKGAKFSGGAVMIGHKRFRQIAKDRFGRHEIFIAADYPTGAFLHEETGNPVAVAVKTMNITKVYAALREIFPNAFIVACLDYDSDDQLERKKIAAEIKKTGGVALIPCFSLLERFNGLVSFNDQAVFNQSRDMVIENMLNQIQFALERHTMTKPSKARVKKRPPKAPAGTPQKNGVKKASPGQSKKTVSRKPSACQKEVNL